MGGLLAIGKAGGTIDGYLATIDAFSTSLATSVNNAYGGTFFTTGTPSGATIAVASADPGRPGQHPLGHRRLGLQRRSRWPSRSCATSASIDGVYKAFVAKVGGDLNESTRMQTNAQVLTDSVEDRRQSVAGVSMDEEMSNLVRFQRAYQASARAMSTMDEMLDVLINRTGKVGL